MIKVRLFSSYDRFHLSRKKILIKTTTIYFILTLVSLFLVVALRAILPIEMRTLENHPNLDRNIQVYGSHSIQMLFYYIIICPVREELMFRLWCSMKRIHIAISCACLTFDCILGYVIAFVLPISIFARLFLAMVVGVLIFILLRQKELTRLKRNRFAYSQLVMCSCILFAIMHLVNYQLTYGTLIFGIATCLPRLAGGISFCYARNNLGFFYCLIFHILINSVASMFG